MCVRVVKSINTQASIDTKTQYLNTILDCKSINTNSIPAAGFTNLPGDYGQKRAFC